MRLTDEQRMLRDVARDFAQTRLAPYAAERDRARLRQPLR
jgi:alkylation response protein AidB-like acyl-CoA dehydrogenase